MIIFDRDDEKDTEMIQAVLKAVEEKDEDKLTSLFAKSTLSELTLFDKQCHDLFEYFTGEVDLVDDWGGSFVETEMEDGFVFQKIESTFDVQTSEAKYRCAMRFVTQGNIEDIGIISLYIIKVENISEDAYWGDGSFTPGIHIGVSNLTQ